MTRGDGKQKPVPIAAAVERFLAESGLAKRVEQATVVPEWASLVGPQIAAVTEPLSVTPDGIMFVAVKTHSWMTELSLMEPELLASLNRRGDRPPVQKIRWQLMR